MVPDEEPVPTVFVRGLSDFNNAAGSANGPNNGRLMA